MATFRRHYNRRLVVPGLDTLQALRRRAADDQLRLHLDWHINAFSNHNSHIQQPRTNLKWKGDGGLFNKLENTNKARLPVTVSLARIRRIRDRWLQGLTPAERQYQKCGGVDPTGMRVRPPLPAHVQPNHSCPRRPNGTPQGPPGRLMLENSSCVVYAIFNKFNTKVYVGVTYKSPLDRFREHVQASRSRRGNPDDDKAGALHRAMQHFGFENFGITVLEYVKADRPLNPNLTSSWHNTPHVRTLEKWWVHRLDAALGSNFGYTIGEGKIYLQRHPRRGGRSGANRMLYKRRLHESDPQQRTGRLNRPLPLTPPLTLQQPPPPPPQQQQQQQPLGPVHWTSSAATFANRLLTFTDPQPAPTLQSATRAVQLHSSIRAASIKKLVRTIAYIRNQKVISQVLHSDYDRHVLLLSLITSRVSEYWAQHTRPRARRKRTLLVSVFNHPDFDKVQLSRILNRRDVRALFPPELIAAGCEYPTVAHCYPPPLRKFLYNYGPHSRRREPPRCTCNRAPQRIRNPRFGDHVVTTDFEHVPLIPPTLATSMRQGTKVRGVGTRSWRDFDMDGSERELRGLLSTATITVNESLGTCIAGINEDFNVQPQLLEPWKQSISMLVTNQVQRLAATPRPTPQTVEVPGCDQARLRDLRRRYVFTYADKCPQSFVVCCASKLFNILYTEVTRQDSPYELAVSLDGMTPATAEQIVDDISRMATQFQVQLGVPNKLPTLVASIKTHKNTPDAVRVIASASACFNTKLAIMINHCLTAMVPSVHQLWMERFLEGGVYSPQAWFINQSSDVLTKIHRHIHLSQAVSDTQQQLTFRVYDFPSMYTTLEHDDLRRKLRSVVNLVFDTVIASRREFYGHDLAIELPGKGTNKSNDPRGFVKLEVRDTDSSGKRVTLVGRDTLLGLIDYFVDHIYVTFGGRIYRQRCGIPMGANCSPLMANLYLFHYEYQHARTLVDRIGASPSIDAVAYSELEGFANISRMIDDVIIVDCPSFNPTVIYPPHAQPTLAHEGPTVPALDMLLTQDDHGFHSKLFDKRKALKLHFRRFPPATSVLSEQCKYGVLGSQIHRFVSICTRDADRIEATVDLAREMIDGGYQPHRLRSVAHRTLLRIQAKRRDNFDAHTFLTALDKALCWESRQKGPSQRRF
jgi:hypothetical protein